MARRSISSVGGFVHDINTVASLSDEPDNIRLLSDRSLYILQNLSSKDITFLSRYGEILTDGFYLPVLAGTSEETDVENAVDLIRRDLNDMSVEELLECICRTNSELVEQAKLDGSAVGEIASDGEVVVGPGEQFPDQESYFDAKCNVSNAIFDTILGMVDWLDDNDVDLLAGLFGGVTSGLLVAIAISGPMGWAWAVVGGLITGIAGYIVRLTVNFSDLSAALGDTHDECVLALYNASDAMTARDNFIVSVEAGSPVITSVESGLLGMFLGSDLLNNLFSPREDIVSYVSPSPVDCGSFGLQTWSFVATGEGWTFRDDSDGAYSASGVHVPAREAWEIELVGPGPGAGKAKGVIWINGLSIAVDVGNSVQMDFGALSGGPSSSKHIKVVYVDLSEFEASVPGTGAGTVILSIETAGTIERIETWVQRAWSTAFVMTMDIEEVRVQ